MRSRHPAAFNNDRVKLFLHPLLVGLLAAAARLLGAPLSVFQISVLVLAAALPSGSNVSGGAAAVAAVIDDAVDRYAADPALAPLLCGRDLPQLKALGVSVFSARVGGPCSTEAAGAEPPDAGMSFSPAELQAVVGGLTEALHEQGVGTVEVGEILSLLYAARRGGTDALSRHSAGNDSRTQAA